jgi:NADPH:quinone reductase-like Zn-dependent oxidoreductase
MPPCTMNSGHWAYLITDSETLPISVLLMPPSPRLPATMSLRLAPRRPHSVPKQLIATSPPIGPAFTEVANLMDNGQIKPVVSRVLPLEDTRKVHTLIEGRPARGTVALQVAS